MNLTPQPEFGKFWDRLGAYLLDAIIIGVPSFLLNYLNFVTIKSFIIYLILLALGIAYKPFMESKYQATLGKMVLNLKVTDYDLKPISYEKSFLRSLIYILPSLAVIPLQYIGFTDPEFKNIESYFTFSQSLGTAFPIMMILNFVFSLIILIDVIVLLTDEAAQNRSLKDRMAKTFVLKVRK
ncbi:hypothetical protein BST97_02875 [Nonlabens spongiae]|uniref:RDD domain-containing protein n=1 Tax=Nonlabens spongiae TaxID=331648 RepID=A0A1W6MHH5_9FLAO|nr:RDD family protein [Nonlabens spongiae]ARN77027.1 hypothetical protein BST97_02875 [Nonlabens spongiae]